MDHVSELPPAALSLLRRIESASDGYFPVDDLTSQEDRDAETVLCNRGLIEWWRIIRSPKEMILPPGEKGLEAYKLTGAGRAYLAELRLHENRKNEQRDPVPKGQWPFHPFDPDCAKCVSTDDGVADAIRNVIPDWDSHNPNWDIVRANLRNLGRTPDEVQAMTISQIRAEFNAGKLQLLELSGEQHTTQNRVDVFDPRPAGETRLTVDLEHDTVILDGTTYPVTPDQAYAVSKLSEAKGGWVPGTGLVRDRESRADRIIGRLPKPIHTLIESKKGTGFRLALA